MKKILFLGFLVFFSLLKNSIADDSEDFVKKVFIELDMNKDGIINIDDVKKFSQKEFDILDKNNDLEISKKEFFNFICQKNCIEKSCECENYENNQEIEYLKEYWGKIDIDKNESLSFQEKLDSDIENFYTIDANNNQQITKDEIEAQLY